MRSIKYTHGYDVLVMVAMSLFSFVIYAVIFTTFKPAIDGVSAFLENHGYSMLSFVFIMTVYVAVLIFSFVILMKTIFPRWLPTYLYVRIALRTKISGKDAEKLNFIFSRSLGNKWYPLKELKNFNMFARRPVLFALANDIAKQNNRPEPFPIAEGVANTTQKINRGGSFSKWKYWIILGVIILIPIIQYGIDQMANETPSEDISELQNDESVKLRKKSGQQSNTASKPTFQRPSLEDSLSIINIASGHTDVFTHKNRICPFEISTPNGKSNYFMKIIDVDSRKPILTAYVNGGKTYRTKVPTGVYEIKYAMGTAWFGTTHLFGLSTTFHKLNRRFDFRLKDGSVHGYSIELILQSSGNLQDENINAAEF